MNATTRIQVVLDPLQSTRVVFGLHDRSASMPCALERDLQIAAMDTPEWLPAGSMTATDYSGTTILMESNVQRCQESSHV